MPDEETTPQTAEEVTPQTETEPTGQEVEAPIGEQEPTPQEPESREWTPERIAELEGFETRYKEIESHKTRVEQENALMREEMEQRNRAIQALSGAVQRQQDPLAAARAEWLEAKQDYGNPEREILAQEKYQDLREQRLREQTRQENFQQQQVNDQLREAKKYGDFTPEDLGRVGQTLTATELAIIARSRKGDLAEFLNSDAERAKAEAGRAAAMNEFFGEGTPGASPGGFTERGNAPTMNWINYTQLNADAKKGFMEQGGKVWGIAEGATDVPDEMRM